ncbi:MAG: DoxX family membrane protein [Pseudomonadota bacterium]
MAVDESGFINQTLAKMSPVTSVAENAQGFVGRFIERGLGAHWFLRVPLAVILFQQGYSKTNGTVAVAEMSGIPLWMYVLAMLAELGGSAGLIVGGLIQTWNPGGWFGRAGSFVTRLSGFAVACVATAVILQFFSTSFVAMRDHLMYVFAGLFFMLYGHTSRVATPKRT